MSEHPLPSSWRMVLPGYAVDDGQTKSERRCAHIVRYVDARGGRLRVWADDGIGVPHAVVLACMAAAEDWPEEFAP